MSRAIRAALALSALPFLAHAASDEERWRSDGYGFLLERDGAELRVYEHNRLGDLLLGTGQRRDGEEDVYVSEDFESVTLVERGGALVVQGLASHPIALVSTEVGPRVPGAERRGDPRFNLDWFAATFADHYAFFELRAVDWAEECERARARLDSPTGDADDADDDALFENLVELVSSLEDEHCSLSALGRNGGPAGEDPDEAASQRFGAFRSLIDEQYLIGDVDRSCEGLVVVGSLADGIAYLRMDAMAGFPLDEVGPAVDAALTRFADARGLVVDVRFNGGGSDEYGLALVARLVDETTFGAGKSVRNDPYDPNGTTRVGEFTVEPSDGPRFRGPVVLLNSRYTASAAEVFGMAMLEREPPVHVVGERTTGVFSDIFARTLPNGWRFGLSNEVYATSAGECFEGFGIPASVEVPTVRVEQLEEGFDPALERAVAILLSSR